MKKRIIITPQAKKYLDDQPEAVQDEFQARFATLATDGRLAFPDARMVERGLLRFAYHPTGTPTARSIAMRLAIRFGY